MASAWIRPFGICTPALRQAIRYAGLTPTIVASVSLGQRHSPPSSGHATSPSNITIEARSSSALTSAFHIIQAVVVGCRSRSPALMSHVIPMFLWCSSRMPPWPCTIGFGSPVVPLLKST